MKLQKGDTVMVIAGKDKSKTGEITRVLPQTNQIVVANINLVKRHTKPDAKNPKGGILSVERPMSVSKVMVVDPTTKRPARIGYKINTKGEKTRVFKVSKFSSKNATKAQPKKTKASEAKS